MRIVSVNIIHVILCHIKYIVLIFLYLAYLTAVLTSLKPVVLYGHETWSLTLREERRLRVFENRILRRIFGPKRGENG